MKAKRKSLSSESLKTIEKLYLKSKGFINVQTINIPSIKKITHVLDELSIKYSIQNKSTTHKNGYVLNIEDKIIIDTTENDYSKNSWHYADRVISLLRSKGLI